MDVDERTCIDTAVGTFVGRWQQSAASERANYGLFLIELCEVLGLPRPEPATGESGPRRVMCSSAQLHFHNPDGTTSTGFIDLYRHDAFVLETKQGCEAKREATLLEQAGLRYAPAASWARHPWHRDLGCGDATRPRPSRAIRQGLARMAAVSDRRRCRP